MEYIIEGTVSEVALEESKISFKISGTEGYSIKQGDKKYNVFCLKDKTLGKAYIFAQKEKITANEKYQILLTAAATNAKKVKVEIRNEKESAPIVLDNPIISLLSD